MSKEINKYLNLSIVMSVLFAILGVILVVSPNSSLDTIAYLLAAFLLVYGTYNFIDSFAIHPIFFFMKMASSVISIILGIVIFLNPEIFKKYFRMQVENCRNQYRKDFMFMFAWNEWAEGGYLEPDEKFKDAYLRAIKEVLEELNEVPENKSCL